MSEPEQPNEAADGQSRLTAGLEVGGKSIQHFHLYSFSYEGVRAAVKKAFEFIHLPTNFTRIDTGKCESEIKADGVEEP